jgi:hypothetical protein
MARDACESAWAQRHVNDSDALAYAAAWCRIRASDRGAIDELGKLARGARREIAKAARLDAVNLIGDGGEPLRAITWLHEMSLDTNDTLDLLAGTYVALGADDDAHVVDEEIARLDPQPTPDVACERLLRASTFDDPNLQLKLEAVGFTTRCTAIRCAFVFASPRSAEEAQTLDRCDKAKRDDRAFAERTHALQLYLGPIVAGYDGDIQDARTLLANPGFPWLAYRAVDDLEEALQQSACSDDKVRDIRSLAAGVSTLVSTLAKDDPAVKERIRRLQSLTSGSCGATAHP